MSARQEWNAALADTPHDLGHTWEYCHALTFTTGLPMHLVVYEQGSVRAVCSIMERRQGDYTDIATPPGFSGFVGTGNDPALSEHWREAARARGYVCAYLGLNPVLPDPGVAGPGDAREYNAVYVLDLSQPAETLFARLDRNRRRQLRHWERDIATLVRDRAALTAFLVREYPAFLERLGAAATDRRSPDTLTALCTADDVILVGTGSPDTVSSVYVFGYTPLVGTCLFHVAHPEARTAAALLVWYGIHELRERGVRWLNLGGGVRENDAVARAKQRFGACRRGLAALRQIFRPDAFTALCRDAGVSPASDGYFPPYRAPAGDWRR